MGAYGLGGRLQSARVLGGLNSEMSSSERTRLITAAMATKGGPHLKTNVF